MEVQMATQGTNRSAGAKAVPSYLRPSAGSCHHVCKYGGTHTFEEKEAHRAHPKPRKQPSVPDTQSTVLVKVRSVFRRRVRDSSRAEKAGAGKAREGDSVEWKDIVAYDTVSAQGSAPVLQVTGSGNATKKDVVKGTKKFYDKAKITEQVDGVKSRNESLEKKVAKSAGSKLTGKVSKEAQEAPDRAASPPHHKNTNTNTDTKSVKVKPPKGKKPTSLLVQKMAVDQEMLHGYQIISPSLIQSRESLLRDLEKEMVDDQATDAKDQSTTYSLDLEEYAAAAAAESSRPIPGHRRVKSMSMSSRSVRFPFARQASKSSATFKLRSRSAKAPILPAEEETKPARLRSRRGEDAGSSTGGRGIQLRIRSLRRRGVGGGGGVGSGFVVPAVALRHQKTLEKKRSQRLYNNMIEETASKLVKTRKSRVRALVGAFESVISKIAK